MVATSPFYDGKTIMQLNHSFIGKYWQVYGCIITGILMIIIPWPRLKVKKERPSACKILDGFSFSKCGVRINSFAFSKPLKERL